MASEWTRVNQNVTRFKPRVLSRNLKVNLSHTAQTLNGTDIMA